MIKNKKQTSQSGFTLIELLVVISIVGILAASLMIALNSARIKSRDVKRISDLGQIRKALELYYDQNGYYPQSSCGWDCNGYYVSYNSTSWASLQTLLAPYMSKLPSDPINTACDPWNTGCYSYTYGNVGRTTWPDHYDLTGQLEDSNSPYRCGVRNYVFFFTQAPWCAAYGGGYSNNIYEASIK